MLKTMKLVVLCWLALSGTLMVGEPAHANGCGIPYVLATNTYSISLPIHFTMLSTCTPTATFNLTADVDLAGITVATRGDFTGTFDGNGYTISNLTVTGTGLFEVDTAGATFNNVNFVNAVVNGGSGAGNGWAGALVREALGPVTITQSSFSGTVTAGTAGNDWAGGFIGRARGNVTITDSYVLAVVSGSALNGWAGGFVGYVSPMVVARTVTLSRNYMIGTIQGGTGGNSWAAGFIGGASDVNMDIADSFVRANLSGGVVGSANSWAHGFVGDYFAGGPNQARLTDSYFEGTLTTGDGGNAWAFGVLGGAPGASVTDVFCVVSCGGGLGTDVSSLVALRTTISSAGWNFSTTWCYSHGHNDGYPVLKALSFGPNAAWGNCVPTPIATAPAPPSTPETTTTTTTSTTTVSCTVASVQENGSGVPTRLQLGKMLVVRDGSVVKSGVSGSAAAIGGAVRVRGRGLTPSSSVDIWLVEGRHFLGTLMTNASGVVSGRLDLPVDVVSGVQTLQMVERNCNTVGTVVSLGVNVSRSTTLPATGGGANPVTWLIGILALVVGVTLRRKHVL